jgi:transcription antitermination factor NusG
MTWYALYTNPRSEWLAHGDLFVSGLETLLLHYWHDGFHARYATRVKKPYFPRYLFACLPDADAIYVALNTRGVHSIVSTTDGPLKIEPGVIAKLKARGDELGLVPPPPIEQRQKFEKGQQVKLLAGPLAGLLALVELDNGADIAVWVEQFRRKLRVNVAPEALAISPQGR